MNSHTYLQNKYLELLMKDNDRIFTYMNETLNNEDVSSGIGLLNSHTLPQDNISNKLIDVNMSVLNGDVDGYYCYMNSSTGSVINNNNYIDYTKKKMNFILTDI